MLIIAIYYLTIIATHVGNIGRMSLEFAVKSANFPKDGWMYIQPFFY